MKKLLIVDNSSYMRMFVKKILQKEGSYTIFEAENKEDAITIFKAENPDIIILDLNMSDATMEGIEVLTDIMKINPKAVVIITSAVGHQNVEDKCIALGAKGYIKKPIAADILLKTLEEYK